MPNFMWVLRDFALTLEDDHGRPQTATEYMEDQLREVYGRVSFPYSHS